MAIVSVILVYLPYYSPFTNKVFIVSYSCYLWGSLSAVISVVISNRADSGAYLVYLVPLPLVIYSAMSFTDLRHSFVKGLKIDEVTSQW